MDNPVVIAGSLSKEELEKSINEIVDAVDDGLNRISEKFDTQLAAIEETFKQAGTKIGTAFRDSFNAAFGGSFDQLAAAMEKASKASENVTKGTKKTEVIVTEFEEPQVKSARESYFAFMKGSGLNEDILEEENKLLQQQIEYVNGLKKAIDRVKEAIKEAQHTHDPNRNKTIEQYRQSIQALENEIKKAEQDPLLGLDTKRLDDLKKMREEINSIIKGEVSSQEQVTQAVEQNAQAQTKVVEQTELVAEKNKELQHEIKQTTQAIQEQQQGEEETIGGLKERIKLQQKVVDEQRRGSAELQNEVNSFAQMRNELKEETMSLPQKLLKAGLEDNAKTLEEATNKLDYLNTLQERYGGTTKLSVQEQKQLTRAIAQTEKQIERMKSKAPKTLKEVMGMDESSVDAIAKKMQALKYVQVDTKNASQVNKLGNEYQRLSRLQAELLGKNIQLTHSNNYLAQSFGYIRNRIVYALTLGALSRFVKELYDVRAQYELLERSLGVLVGSFERGSQIFQELNQMALKSPFTLIELSTAAKQLTAYDFAADEVVNTTRRLADISAALGVPMERLTYNLGQIRAQTVLTARDARDFANAGLPIVKELADYYSMLEGRIVSTGDVYDRMKKKMVSYEDVLTIINKVTDEGGKFFDFQAKQAETLKVQLANLSLAWNNMLNEIGKNNSKALGAPVGALKTIFENWRELSHVIGEVIVAYGAYRAYQLVINRLMGVNSTLIKKDILANKEKIAVDLQREAFTRKLSKEEKKLIATRRTITSQDYQNILSSRQLTKSQALLLVARNKNNVALTDAVVKMGLLTRAEIRNITTSKALQIQLNQVWVSLKNMMAGIASFAKANWWMLLIGALVETVHTYGEIQDQIKYINRGIVDSAKESRESIAQMLKEYADAKNRAKEGSFTDEEGAKIWERIKEEIELSSAAGKTFVERLKQIPNINQRISKGFDYLQMIHDVNGALEQIDEKAIDINGDWSKWWNLWAAPDGLVENLKEYVETLEKAKKAYGTFESAQEADQRARRQGSVTSWKWDEVQLKENIQTTTESMVSAFQTVGVTSGEAMREAFERSNQKILADANVSAKERLQYNIIAEQEFIKVRIKQFDDEYEYEKQRGNEERAERVRLEKQAWINAFGEGEVISTAFFDFLKNQHSSEVSEMFGNMSKKEIENLDWSKGRWHDWAEDMAKSFADQNDIAFDKLKKHVEDANKWKIFIQMFITSQNKTLYDELTEQDKLAQEAQSRVERLEKFISDQKKKGLANDEKTLNAIKEQKTAQDDLNDALSKGGRLKESSKGSGKSQKDPLGDALTKELQLITDIQKLYKEYTKAGVDSETAKNAAAKEYQKTLEQTNATLAKFGIQGLTGDKLATMDLRAMRDYYQSILEDVQSSPKAVEALEKAIRNLNVELTKEGQKTIIDSLNNELSKLKDEYELGVELDANPELGRAFAEAFNIGISEYPHTIEDVINRAQNAINNALLDNGYSKFFDILKGDTESLRESMGQSVDSNFIDAVEKAQKTVRDLWKKDAQETISGWDKLLEKYAEYEYKRKKIMEEAEKERQIAIKRNAGDDILNAINTQTQRRLAELDFEQFQRSPEWIAATGDLATLTDKAIGMLISDLEKYKKSAKNLDPKQIRQINSALTKLYKEQRKGNPFMAIANAMDEAKEKAQPFLDKVEELKNRQEELQRKASQSDSGVIISKEELKELDELPDKIQKAEDKAKELGKVTATEIVAAINNMLQPINAITSAVGDMFAAFGNSAASENLQKIGQVLDKAGQFAAMGAQSGNGWAALAGGILGGLMGAMTAFADELSGNASITRKVERSEKVVKRLEVSYNRLEHAASNAYGVEIAGAQQATIENKKLQLVELQRQLQLERSRDKKHRDEERIYELQEQVESLRMEIKDASTDIVNDLLGISSVGDGVTNLVQVMIDAFRNGEDAMEAFGKEWDKMIDNMILKLIVSEYMKREWENIIGYIDEQKDNFLAQSAKNRADAEDALTIWQNKSFSQWANEYYGYGEFDLATLYNNYREGYVALLNEYYRMKSQYIEGYTQGIAQSLEDEEKASKEWTEWSLDFMMNEGRDLMMSAAERAKEGIDKYYDFGELAEGQKLSNLQQGIQSITEDTAGALEAMLNGISQQVYLHSDILIEIRDVLQSFDFDVRTGVQAQILLELQTGFQTVNAMRTMMENWQTAAGNGIKVEIL